MANKAAYGSGSSFDSSTSFPLDHVDGDEAWNCRNFMGGAHAFANLPNPWRRFDSSATAPYLHPPFLSNKIEACLVISLSVHSDASMVAEPSSIGGDFRAMAGGALCTGVLPILAVTVTERGRCAGI